jgi:branched-subunit amino acid ABC-type transport system permease component
MLSIAVIAQILWTSFATASYFVLSALAFAIVLKVNRLFNFAQAAVMTVAFYASYTAVGLLGLSGWAGFLAALAASLALSAVLEIVGFRVLRRQGASTMFVFIFTLMISELIAYLAMLIYGTWPATIFPSLFWPATLVGPVAVSGWDVPAVTTMLAACAALYAFLRLTRPGQFMVAVADNPDLAELYGIVNDRIYLISMLIAGALGAVAMFLYGTRAQVQPTTSIDLLLFAIAASVIGGIGNIWGAACTAIVLALLQNTSVLFIPSEWQGFLLYIVLFLAIVFFPQGIHFRKISQIFGGLKLRKLDNANKIDA